ncbi:MAG: S-layer homology domain-containing protein [Propioniciclava sp.]|uniref:S-layer homology domain-containing protein n=1 Tax=Propioniciclava sp. TaxID=2038686 RepID=UPI0039E54620
MQNAHSFPPPHESRHVRWRRVFAGVTALAVAGACLQAMPAASAPHDRSTSSSTSVTLGAVPDGIQVPALPSTAGVAARAASSPEAAFARQEVAQEVAIAAVVVDSGADPGQVFLRTVHDGTPTTWEAVGIEDDGTAGDPTTSTVPVDVSGAEAVEVVALAASAPATLQVHTSAVTAADARASDLAWDSPRILSRRAWGADESLRQYDYTRGQVTGAMIHHTAGSNDYTAAQVPALLRAIQAYHVNGRDWNDIAYNVLVDRFGRAWEGRGGGINQPIQGGHAWGETNARTFGLSIMGDYDTVRPSAAALETTSQVIAWKLQMHGVDPYGATWGSGGQDGGNTALRAISGHRDENATVCPGKYVYEKLGSIRARVKTLMNAVRYPRFRDVPPGMSFESDIRWLATRDISTGWPDGTFRPLQPISREAMAAFLYRLSGSPEFTAPETSPFRDVQPSDAFYTEISWLAATGIATGYQDRTFRPRAPITRDAMAAYLHRLYGSPKTKTPAKRPFVDVGNGTQFGAEMAWLAATGISTGWTTSRGAEYRPTQPVNRDAMAAFMHRATSRLGNPAPVLRSGPRGG